MYTSSFTMKAISSIVLLSFLNLLIAPTLLMATNTGPVAPEATGFEPVESTDMVNLISGDFSYVLPVLNVPGPEGGYPLTLSYHAGIAALQEASWVGLGWSMTVGAINRTVNGIPDDWKHKARTGVVNDDGTTETYRQVDYGANFKGVSIGISRSYKNNRANGGSVSLGYVDPKSGVGGGISLGSSGFGVNISTSVANVAGMNKEQRQKNRDNDPTNNKDLTGTERVGIGYHSNRGLSLEGNATGGSAGIGISLKSGMVNSYSSAYSGDRGAGTSFDFQGTSNYSMTVESNVANEWDYGLASHKDVRTTVTVWMHNELQKEYTGVLYYDDSRNDLLDGTDVQSRNYKTDVYHVPVSGNNYKTEDIIKGSQSILLPGYDGYVLSGQGIGGSMSPHFYKHAYLVDEATYVGIPKVVLGQLNGQIDLKNKKSYESSFTSFSTPKVHFTLNQVPDSYVEVENGTHTFPAGPITNSGNFTYSGGTLNHTLNGQSNFNITDHRRGAANYIEWFTNKEIVEQTATARSKGYIGVSGEYLESQQPAFAYSGFRDSGSLIYGETDENGIGAIQVTVSDGKTYHYSLPVYNQVTVSKTYETAVALNRFYENREQDKYAYSWLLTAVTGPDYYDANDNGLVDEEDYGYWVAFDHGRFYNGAGWKFPYNGESKSEVNEHESHSHTWGLKELYYLNSIKTRTHTAYFIKSERKDGLGAQTPGGVKLSTSYSSLYYNNVNANKDLFSWCTDPSPVGIESDVAEEVPIYYTSEVTIPFKSAPMKLDKIILVKNEDANLVHGVSQPVKLGEVEYTNAEKLLQINAVAKGWLNVSPTPPLPPDYNSPLDYCRSKITKLDENRVYTNVYDTYDLDDYNLANPDWEDKAEGVVEFEYDYSLAANTENSDATTGGRLTLNQVKISGNGGNSTLPPYLFSYYNDIAYDEANVDEWGYNADSWHQIMDEHSKTKVHQWSLKEITTPMGAKIKVNYESDTYKAEAIGYNGQSYWDAKDFGIRDIEKLSSTTFRLSFYMPFPIGNWFELNEYYHFGIVYAGSDWYDLNCGGITKYNNSGTYKITSINEPLRQIVINTDVNDPKVIHDADAITGNNELSCMNAGIFKLKPEESLAASTGHRFPASRTLKGGGVRVTSIELSDEDGNTYKTNYDYNTPISNSPSGITSYNATILNMKGGLKYIPYSAEIPGPGVKYEYVTVTNTGSNGLSDGLKTIYHFEVLPVSTNTNSRSFRMGDYFKVDDDQHSLAYAKEVTGTYPGFIWARSTTIKDNTSRLGRIKSVRHLTEHDQEVYHTAYTYNDNSKLGMSMETFTHKYSQKDDLANITNWKVVAAAKKKSANYLTAVKTRSEGHEFDVQYEDHDFNTGSPLTKRYKNSFNMEYVEKTVPAYSIAAYAEMGLKSTNAANKNMLSQKAENSLVFVEAGKADQVVSASVQTWNKNWLYRDYVGSAYTNVAASDVWRKHEQYNWKATNINLDGTYRASATDVYVPYNWGGSLAANWEKTSEITRYDRYSHAMESKVLENGNLSSGNIAYASSKRHDSKGMVVLSASVSKYNEAAFSGAEFDLVNGNYFEAEVEKGGGTVDNTRSHTGVHCMKTTGLQSAFEYRVPDGDYNKYTRYLVNVWVYNVDNNVADANIELSYRNAAEQEVSNVVGNTTSTAYGSAEYVKAGDWTRMSFVIPNLSDNELLGTATSLVVKIKGGTIAGVMYFDDFRVQPYHGALKSYVYDDRDRISAILDDRNFATVFKYNNAGELIEIHQEFADENGLIGGIKKISEHDKNYARN